MSGSAGASRDGEQSIVRGAVASAAGYAGQWLEFRQRHLRVPGVQAAVLHDGEFLLSDAWGLADVAGAEPLTTGHAFRVASHSKTFTATVVLRLAERGVLRLDDEIGVWLAWLTEAGSPLATRTVRDLLSHAGGLLRDGHGSDHWTLAEPFPDEAALRLLALAAGAAVGPANERFTYSNIGYGLLGLVIEAAAGRTYGQVVTSEVLVPLGLTRTTTDLRGDGDGPAAESRLATGYSALAYADERVPVDSVPAAALAAATGFVSTAEDLCRYTAGHFPGDDRILAESSKRLMQRPWWPIEGLPGAAYGLGWQFVTVGERQLPGHAGGWPGHITRTAFDPDRRLAVSVLTNAIDGPAQELVTGVLRLVETAVGHARRRPGTAGSGAPSDLAHFCGRFANLWGVVDVAELGGRLVAVNPGAPDPTAGLTVLDVIDDDTLRAVSGTGVGSGFSAIGEPVRYERSPDGSVEVVRTPSGTARPIERFVLPPHVAAPAA